MLELVVLNAGNIVTLIGGVGALVFTVSYGLFFHWRRTEAGRSLFYVFASIVILFLNNSLGAWLGPDYPGRVYLRLVIVTAVTITLWRLVWVLWRNWRKGDPRPLDIEAKPRKREP